MVINGLTVIGIILTGSVTGYSLGRRSLMKSHEIILGFAVLSAGVVLLCLGLF